MKPPRARFWVGHFTSSGNWTWVRLILSAERPRLERVEYSRAWDGSSMRATVWRYDMESRTVTRTLYDDATDCDGRTSSTSRERCHVAHLASRPATEDGGPPLPAWQSVRRDCRDYAAEAAGY